MSMRRTRENDEGGTVQLTLSNAVDQTQKILVEVPAGTSVADAAIDAGIAPKAPSMSSLLVVSRSPAQMSTSTVIPCSTSDLRRLQEGLRSSY